MNADLGPDGLAEVRRVMRFLEDGAPLAPDLPQGNAGTTPRGGRNSRMVGLIAFVVVLASLVPLTILLRGDESAEVPATTVRDEPTVGPTVAEEPADPALGLASLPGFADPRRVTIPVEGTEPFLLATGGDVVFTAASLPNPEVWDERVWRSLDGGADWTEVLAVGGEGIVVDLAADGDVVVALLSGQVVDGPSVLYRSNDAGETWQRSVLPVPNGLDPVNVAVTAVAVGERVLVAGFTWHQSADEAVAEEANGYRSWVWTADGDGSWAVVEVAAQGHIQDLAWSGEIFVAVGGSLHPTDPHDNEALAVWTSTDGRLWVTMAVPQPPDGIRTSDGLESVAIGPDGSIVAHTPAQEWSVITVGGDAVEQATEAELRALIESGGAFREATTAGTAIVYSADGAEWHGSYLDGRVIAAAVGTPWGFAAAAVPVNPPYDYQLLASADGASWTDRVAIDAHVAGGSGGTDEMFLSGFADTPTGSQQAVIWRADWQ